MTVKLRRNIEEILRKLCKRKKLEIIRGVQVTGLEPA